MKLILEDMETEEWDTITIVVSKATMEWTELDPKDPAEKPEEEKKSSVTAIAGGKQ